MGLSELFALELYHKYFSRAPWENKARHFFLDQPRKGQAKTLGIGCGGTSRREGGGLATVPNPRVKGPGAQVMHKALTVCPHCLLHKRGWDWEKGGSFQDTGQQPLECPDHPSPQQAVKAVGRGGGRRDAFVPFFLQG